MKLQKNINKQLVIAMLAMLPLSMQAQTPAFPGAEGYAALTTTGGRGTLNSSTGLYSGKVYHVTTLEDDGTTSLKGSLRWANAQSGPRIIVFDVSGTIHLTKALKLSTNTTLAGQTAPGDGICIAGAQVTLQANNIVRFVRFRPGDEIAGEWDGLGAMDSKNIIVDHCSVSWSVDECLSVYGSTNITVQWCIASQSLNSSNHNKGNHGYGGNWGGAGASYHHNLIAHHVSRTPRLGPRPGTQTKEHMDMRNNVIYNWIDNGCYGGEGMKVNIVNNYYKPGPSTKTGAKGKRIAAIGVRTTDYCTDKKTGEWNEWHPMWHVWGKFFVEGNVNSKYSDVTEDNWKNGIYNQTSNGSGVDNTWTQETRDTIRLEAPIAFEPTTTHTAEDAFERVLAYAGASLHRDALDQTIVSDALNGETTYTGTNCSKGIINTVADAGGYPELRSADAPADTDGDGMPDSWEDAHGLNKNSADDGRQDSGDGYTHLEVYLNSLVADIVEQQNDGGTVMSSDGTDGIEPITQLSTPATPNIYALDGRMLKANASYNDFLQMPCGIYIVNGKKAIRN